MYIVWPEKTTWPRNLFRMKMIKWSIICLIFDSISSMMLYVILWGNILQKGFLYNLNLIQTSGKLRLNNIKRGKVACSGWSHCAPIAKVWIIWSGTHESDLKVGKDFSFTFLIVICFSCRAQCPPYKIQIFTLSTMRLHPLSPIPLNSRCQKSPLTKVSENTTGWLYWSCRHWRTTCPTFLPHSLDPSCRRGPVYKFKFCPRIFPASWQSHSHGRIVLKTFVSSARSSYSYKWLLYKYSKETFFWNFTNPARQGHINCFKLLLHNQCNSGQLKRLKWLKMWHFILH